MFKKRRSKWIGQNEESTKKNNPAIVRWKQKTTCFIDTKKSVAPTRIKKHTLISLWFHFSFTYCLCVCVFACSFTYGILHTGHLTVLHYIDVLYLCVFGCYFLLLIAVVVASFIPFLLLTVAISTWCYFRLFASVFFSYSFSNWLLLLFLLHCNLIS